MRYILASETSQPAPLCGLSDPKEPIQLLHLPDQAIATIRDMADHVPLGLAGAVTRHFHPELNGFKMIEYASVAARESNHTPMKVHYRWITMPNGEWKDDLMSMVSIRATYIRETLGELCGLLQPCEAY